MMEKARLGIDARVVMFKILSCAFQCQDGVAEPVIVNRRWQR